MGGTYRIGVIGGDGIGPEVTAAALRVLDAAEQRFGFRTTREQLGWSSANIDEYVVHQVSAVHTAQLAESFGADLGRFHKIYPTYGNIGPAGVPTVLKKSLDAGRIRDGQRLALMGIGSGLNCSMMEVVW